MKMDSARKGVEEDAGVLKSGVIVAGFSPIKSKKTFYAVLGERSLELHESEKSYRKRKAAKHLIDLSVAFNVHKDHLDPKLKQCVCVMGPDETLCLKADSAKLNQEWYQAICQALIPSRALKLGRPVSADEFFECAWDVEVVANPKVKRPITNEERLPNMCDRRDDLEPGPRRLCFYPHTIVLCKRRIEPTVVGAPPSSCPPFNSADFLELQRMYVAFFGSQERYFLITMGRGSSTGGCELWMQCESNEVANDIHLKLNFIIERESEKKRKINVGDTVSNLSVVRTSHRDRSHTQPTRTANGHDPTESAEPPVAAVHTVAPIVSVARGRRGVLRDSLSEKRALMASFEEDSGSRLQAPQLVAVAAASHLRSRGSLGNPTAVDLLGRRLCSPAVSTSLIGRKSSAASMGSGSLSARSNTFSPGSGSPSKSSSTPRWSVFPPQQRRSSNSSSIMEEQSNYQEMACVPKKADSVSNEGSVNEETEDSGGTLRLDGDEYGKEISLNVGGHLSEPRSKDASDQDERSSVGGISGASMASSSAEVPEDYAPMDGSECYYGSNNLIVPQYDRFHNFEESKYVSDSTDSCYSSMAANSTMTSSAVANTPRAYSFGGRAQMKPVPTAVCESGLLDLKESTGNLVLPADDPRKRAFSLGSKIFLPRPFRKNANYSNRQQRHSQTSASGASLASSAGSSFGPSSSSSNHLAMSSEHDDTGRQRSGSFGSGRSTPYTKRSEENPGDAPHVAMDFSNAGRSCSGSMASIDSPSRSRTSSFGCGRKEDFFVTAAEISLESLKLNQHFSKGSKKEEEVEEAAVYETPSFSGNSLAVFPPLEPYLPDMRSSQVIETIEESASESSTGSRISLEEAKETKEEDEYAMMEAPSQSAVDKAARPERWASPMRDALAAPTGLPKRCSVPSMRSDSKDDSGLNYASLQIHDDSLKPGSVPNDSLLYSPSSSRGRSKSGILFSADAPTDYASVKPM